MRIIGGTHRSRTLFTPKSNTVRPTSDKIRQAVFNMINARGWVEDAVVIDAFCGTGALGLEALSQGATFCTFFDKNKQSIELCKKNIQSLKEEDKCQIMMWDSTKLKLPPEKASPATLVFLDPPYKQYLVSKAIISLDDNNWLDSDCCFVIETAKDEIINCPRINILSEKLYGDTKILLGTLK